MKRLPSLIIALLIAGPGFAQETAADWTAKLGRREYAERETAARSLEKLGNAAMPALRDAALTADLETKRRAIALMEKIEDRMMIDEVTTATPIRLQFKDADLDGALGSIEYEFGLETMRPAKNRRIPDVDTGVLPFWQAWRRFCVAVALEERDFASSAGPLRRFDEDKAHDIFKMLAQKRFLEHPRFRPGSLEFAAGPPFGVYAADDRGSVRVCMKWHALDKEIDAKFPHAVFAVEVRPEPRLGIISRTMVEITKIIDDQGRTRMTPTAKLYPAPGGPYEASYFATLSGEVQFGGKLHLKAFPWAGPPRSLKEVHGRVRFDVVSRPRVIEIPDVLKSIGKQAKAYSGVTLKILEAEMIDEEHLQLRLRLEHLESLTPQSLEQQAVRLKSGVIAIRGPMDFALDRLELVNRAGQKCRLLKSRYETLQEGKAYEAELYFAVVGRKEELMLVMTKAARTVPVDVPFVVRDVVW